MLPNQNNKNADNRKNMPQNMAAAAGTSWQMPQVMQNPMATNFQFYPNNFVMQQNMNMLQMQQMQQTPMMNPFFMAMQMQQMQQMQMMQNMMMQNSNALQSNNQKTNNQHPQNGHQSNKGRQSKGTPTNGNIKKNQPVPKADGTQPTSATKPPMTEETKEEIDKWLQARKRNYPSKANVERKNQEKAAKEEAGELVEPQLSALEIKLRKKIRIMKLMNSKSIRRKERVKSLLARAYQHPFKVDLPYKKKAEQGDEDNEGNNNNPTPDKPTNNASAHKNPQPEVKANGNENDQNVQSEEHAAFQEFQKQISALESNGADDGDAPIERPMIKESKLLEKSNQRSKPEARPVQAKQKLSKFAPKVRKIVKKSNGEGTDSKAGYEDPEAIIKTLQQKKLEEKDHLGQFVQPRVVNTDYQYKTNTLLTSLLLDSIYNEKDVLLQCLHYIRANNFFDEN